MVTSMPLVSGLPTASEHAKERQFLPTLLWTGAWRWGRGGGGVEHSTCQAVAPPTLGPGLLSHAPNGCGFS